MQENQIHQAHSRFKEGRPVVPPDGCPNFQEAPRPKSHWDYLLEEMQWMATDFAQRKGGGRWPLLRGRFGTQAITVLQA